MKLNILLLMLWFVSIKSSSLKGCPARYFLDPAVTNFRRYIQIDTSREENLHKAVEFWRRQALELGLPFNIFKPAGLPICVISVIGTDPSLPSIMLNSHMDVVPADEREWTYPPYSAYIDENGDIYGRGTQDDKDVGIQYIEAIRRLRRDNVQLRRTIHLTLMPDEEIGGFRGIKPFVKTEAFKAMNVGFALDEGIPSPDDTLLAFFEDKRPWQLRVTVNGESGHGSGMPDMTAMEKARKFINIVDTYRERMKTIVKSSDPTDYGRYTSVNMNMIDGGYRPNIIPSSFDIIVDMRLASDSNITEIDEMIKSWLVEAGNGTEMTFLRRDEVSKRTRLDETNPYWVAMRNAVIEMGYEINPLVCPATSDMLVLRNMGIYAVGFSTKLQTKIRVHGRDEYLNAETFLRGIDIYYEILKSVANCDRGYEIIPLVLPATSDMLVLRNMGIYAVGFSTKLQTKVRAHGKDEYLNAETLLRGIDIYYEILKRVANCDK